jgi:hypothetical protein
MRMDVLVIVTMMVMTMIMGMAVAMFMFVIMSVFMFVLMIMSVMVMFMPSMIRISVVVRTDAHRIFTGQSAAAIFTHLFNLHGSEFHFPPGPQIAAGGMALRAFGKHVFRLELPLAYMTPETRRHGVDGQFSAFSQGSRSERLKRESQGLRHYSTKGPNPQPQ